MGCDWIGCIICTKFTGDPQNSRCGGVDSVRSITADVVAAAVVVGAVAVFDGVGDGEKRLLNSSSVAGGGGESSSRLRPLWN